MKRTIKLLVTMLALVVLIAALAITLAACDKDNEQGGTYGKNPGTSTSNEEIPHKHNYKVVEAKSPTCTVDGNVKYYACSCGKILSANKVEILKAATVLPAKGHDKVTTSWESDDVSHWHKCNNCDAKFDIQMHIEGSDIIRDSEATCSSLPHFHRECTVCHHSVAEFDFGELLPHEFGDWIDDTPATCTKQAHHHRNCVNCGYTESEDYGELLPHDFGNWIIDGENVCNKDNTPVPRHKECANCEYTIVDENYIVPHTWKEQLTGDRQKECTKCGYKENVYEERDGKIYLGEYPQTKETDDGITATLAQMSGDRPVKGNAGKWTDYGYFIGLNTTSYGGYGVPVKDEFMWYIDLEYDGARYRGVYFTSYRPIATDADGLTHQDDNAYYVNSLYWFKWEPIEWRVLEKTDGEAFLMSNVILDSQQYYWKHGVRSIDGKYIVSPNNYKESDIRAWLNGTFYNQAFDELAQAIINETLVDNSAATTGYSSNENACENTSDKVFLLSYADVMNPSYGFNPDSGCDDEARRLKPTDYAQSQGAFVLRTADSIYYGNGYWMLRSPSDYNSISVLEVIYSGDADFAAPVECTDRGVVPAIKIQL